MLLITSKPQTKSQEELEAQQLLLLRSTSVASSYSTTMLPAPVMKPLLVSPQKIRVLNSTAKQESVEDFLIANGGNGGSGEGEQMDEILEASGEEPITHIS